MTSLSSALDNINNLKIGENNNLQYDWNVEFNNLLTQLNFQLVRDKDNNELIIKKIIYF